MTTPSAAFFDLDRTLMYGSSAWYFGKAAYREGLRPLSALGQDLVNAVLFRLFGASDEKSEALRDQILRAVAGTEADRFGRMIPGVVEELLPRIRPESQALIDMHAEAGRDIYIISASPVEVVGELAKALDLTGGLGTESEIVDGVYTGRLAAPFCYGEGKAEVVRKLVAEVGYDLNQCYAYADSASDLPILTLVGHPVAVNPDRSLATVAHRRGWPLVEFDRERKQLMKLSATGAALLVSGGTGYAFGRRAGFLAATTERERRAWRRMIRR
jgi:HAD superfamily hydrolase (TIGR01490 family)